VEIAAIPFLFLGQIKKAGLNADVPPRKSGSPASLPVGVEKSWRPLQACLSGEKSLPVGREILDRRQTGWVKNSEATIAATIEEI
jgi:hypothetical protein